MCLILKIFRKNLWWRRPSLPLWSTLQESLKRAQEGEWNSFQGERGRGGGFKKWQRESLKDCVLSCFSFQHGEWGSCSFITAAEDVWATQRGQLTISDTPSRSLLSFRKVRRVNHEVVQTAAPAYTSATCWCAVCGTFWIDFLLQIEQCLVLLMLE